eukprot:gene26306-31778_t
MFPKIDGMYNEEVEFHGCDIDKIDGIGSKTVRASNGQDLIIHNKIDGSGTHKLIGFGFVEVRDKVDGSGDRWFIDCGRVVINDRKDGMGNLYLVNSPCNITKKSGSGNIVWCGVPPTVESQGVLNMGEAIEDVSLMSASEGQGRVKVDKAVINGPTPQDVRSTEGKVQLDLGAHHLGSGSEFERKIRIDQGPLGDSESRGDSGRGFGESQRPPLFTEGDRKDTSSARQTEGVEHEHDDRQGEHLGTGAVCTELSQRSDFQGRNDLGSGHSGRDDLGIGQQRPGTQHQDQQVRDSSDWRGIPSSFQNDKDSSFLRDKLGDVADRAESGFKQTKVQKERNQEDLGMERRGNKDTGSHFPLEDKSHVRDSSDMKDVPYGFQKERFVRQREEDRKGSNVNEFDNRTIDTEQNSQLDRSTENNNLDPSRSGRKLQIDGDGDSDQRKREQNFNVLGGGQGRHLDQGKALGFDQPDPSQPGQGQDKGGDFDRGRGHDQGHGQGRHLDQGKALGFDQPDPSQPGQGSDKGDHVDGSSEQFRKDYSGFVRDRNIQQQSKGEGEMEIDSKKGSMDLQQRGFHSDRGQQGRDDLDLNGTDPHIRGGDEEQHNDEECETGVCKIHRSQQTEETDEPKTDSHEGTDKEEKEKDETGLMEKVTGLMNRLF